MVAYSSDIPKEDPLKWISVNIQEVVDTGYRLEASVYVSEGRQARQDLEQCRWPLRNLAGEDGLVSLFRYPQFKNTYVEESDFPYFQPAQINELAPKPMHYLSPTLRTEIENFRVKKGQVLMTCSGTIGNCTYVRNTLNNLIFSTDLIRIEPDVHNGFIYAFLKSKTGKALITSSNYGAVIQHINPEHLYDLPVPNPTINLKQEIHNLIEESFRSRDESNELMGRAQVLLKTALQLPEIHELWDQAGQFDRTSGVINYSVPSSEVIDRLDASYYVPIVKAIEQRIAKTANEILKVEDSRITESIFLPGRFKRVYVEEGNGITFFTGKSISELDPSDKKYLSFSQHTEKIENELIIREGMILITSSGTLANTVLVPKHWNGWAMTHDIIRLVPASNDISGYLYAWLSSDYARELIHRFAYGAVVRHLEKEHIMQVSVPLLHDKNKQREINDMVLEANRKRNEAYNLEQEALKVLDEKVIYAL